MKVGFAESPTGTYKAFRRAIKDAASVICLDLDDRGLVGMGHHLTGEEYAAYAETRRPAIPGQKIIFTRPVLAVGATAPAYNTYKTQREDYNSFTNGMKELKSMVIEALGECIREQLTTEDSPVSSKSLDEILCYISINYGVPTLRDIEKLLAKVHRKCDKDSDVFNYIKMLDRHFIELAELRYAFDELYKMQVLIKGTASCTLTRDAIDQYTRDTPVLANRTYKFMCMAILVALPNHHMEEHHIATGYMAKPTETNVTDARIAALENQVKTLLSMNDRLTKNHSLPPATMYCFTHGANRSHNGTTCRHMIEGTGYLKAHRDAKVPCTIDGKIGNPRAI